MKDKLKFTAFQHNFCSRSLSEGWRIVEGKRHVVWLWFTLRRAYGLLVAFCLENKWCGQLRYGVACRLAGKCWASGVDFTFQLERREFANGWFNPTVCVLLFRRRLPLLCTESPLIVSIYAVSRFSVSLLFSKETKLDVLILFWEASVNVTNPSDMWGADMSDFQWRCVAFDWILHIYKANNIFIYFLFQSNVLLLLIWIVGCCFRMISGSHVYVYVFDCDL